MSASVFIPADLETPVTCFTKLRELGAVVLLESAEQDERIGRYSFIALNPKTRFHLYKDRVLIKDGDTKTLEIKPGDNPLAIVHSCVKQQHSLAILGAAIGYAGYDYVRYVEKLPERLPYTTDLPICSFFIPSEYVIFDHFKKTIQIVAADISRCEKIAGAITGNPNPKKTFSAKNGWQTTLSEQEFMNRVDRAKEYIRAGDIFQVVLSHEVSCDYEGDPFQVYRALRIINPSPYMFYIDFGDFEVVGSSPEMHLKVEQSVATIRPIAGTRPRGADPDSDSKLVTELLDSEKDSAEHIMLVDLARNDLGRCCRMGTVKPKSFKILEKFSRVMHLTSEVSGLLDSNSSLPDVFAKSFPAGTVSGAPKIRAMEIIEELEANRRGVYGGAVGYIGANSMDFCISIRMLTFVGGKILLRAGAGIVFDSDPKSEWEETLHKMQALKDAVELASEDFKCIEKFL